MTASGPRPLRLATRRSALAMAQSRAVGEALSALTGRPLELVEVTTQGDVDRGSLAQIGGTGVFVAAVRQAVVAGEADLAVHSLKDLPTAPDPRLQLAAVPPREDPRDALVCARGSSVADLPAGARVGTGSPRRRAQLLALRPDLAVVDLRGNVDTRLGRVAVPTSGPAPTGTADLDAVVLAAAGLARLGRKDRVSALFDPDQMLPAPGQGALAVEVRADLAQSDPQDGPALADALAQMDHAPTRAAVAAERALLAALEAGCSAPVGALAEVVDEGIPGGAATLTLRAVMARPDGTLARARDAGPAERAEEIGRALAARLLADAGDSGPRPEPSGSTSRTTSTTSETSTTRTTGTTSTALPRPTTAQGSHTR